MSGNALRVALRVAVGVAVALRVALGVADPVGVDDEPGEVVADEALGVPVAVALGVALGDCVGGVHENVYAFPWNYTAVTVVFTVPGGFLV